MLGIIGLICAAAKSGRNRGRSLNPPNDVKPGNVRECRNTYPFCFMVVVKDARCVSAGIDKRAGAEGGEDVREGVRDESGEADIWS